MLEENELLEEHDLDIVDFINRGIPRQIYIRNDYFNSYDAVAFKKRFRLTRECCLYLLEQIEDRLEFSLDCNNLVSPINQLLMCLRMYSTGGHLQAIADYGGMHLSTVSRIMVRVSEAIASLRLRYIKFPENAQELIEIQRKFYDVLSFPRVIGDCTHIKISSPGGDDAEIFRNRKSYFSINVQCICDAELNILNIVARWPGSSHDSTIYNNSRIKANLTNDLYRQCLLIGDSGYMNSNNLLTPLLNSQNREEQLYNEAHIRTRNVIERLFGVLKRRFPILAYGCRLKLNTVLKIIIATAVLHNLCLNIGDRMPPPPPNELDIHEMDRLIEGNIPEVLNERANGVFNLRAQFINNYFANL